MSAGQQEQVPPLRLAALGSGRDDGNFLAPPSPHLEYQLALQMTRLADPQRLLGLRQVIERDMRLSGRPPPAKVGAPPRRAAGGAWTYLAACRPASGPRRTARRRPPPPCRTPRRNSSRPW